MRTGATFRVHGVDARTVTAVLGIESTTPPGQPWRLSVEPADQTELDEPIESLLKMLEASGAGLQQLRSDGATFDVFCYLGSNAAEHCAVLEPELLRRLADLPAELWLDVYEDDHD